MIQNENLSEILNKLSDETKNRLIEALLEHDKKDVSIVETPIYQHITDNNGAILGQRIKSTVYGVAITHRPEEYREYDFTYEISYVDKDYTYHIVEANKDNFEETVYKIFANGGFEVEIACTYVDKERE